jgi:hypothetical protein
MVVLFVYKIVHNCNYSKVNPKHLLKNKRILLSKGNIYLNFIYSLRLFAVATTFGMKKLPGMKKLLIACNFSQDLSF